MGDVCTVSHLALIGLRVLTPIGNKSPTQRVKGNRADLMVASDDQEVLARRGVPTRWIVVRTAVAHVHAFDNAVTQRAAALDYPSAHLLYVVVGRRTSNGAITDNEVTRSRRT